MQEKQHIPRERQTETKITRMSRLYILWSPQVFYDAEKGQYGAIGFCRRYRNVFLITSRDGKHWDDSEW